MAANTSATPGNSKPEFFVDVLPRHQPNAKTQELDMGFRVVLETRESTIYFSGPEKTISDIITFMRTVPCGAVGGDLTIKKYVHHEKNETWYKIE